MIPDKDEQMEVAEGKPYLPSHKNSQQEYNADTIAAFLEIQEILKDPSRAQRWTAEEFIAQYCHD